MRNLAKNILILIGLSLLFAGPLMAQESKDKPVANKVKVKKSGSKSDKAKKKKIGVDQSDFMPDANRFGFIVSYGASYNDLELVDTKTVNHRVSFSGTYGFDKHWSSYASIGASHETYDGNIYRANDSDNFHNLSNLNLGVVYSKMKPLSFVRRSSNTLNIGLPVSERSRVDNHIGTISLTNFMQSYDWNRFSVFNRALVQYLGQTQRFSVFNNDTLNRDFLLSNSFGLTYMPLKRVGLRYSVRINGVRFLDSSWNVSFGNNASIFANYFGVQFFASMINNSYPEDERIDLVYFDEFRRTFMGGLTYAF